MRKNRLFVTVLAWIVGILAAWGPAGAAQMEGIAAVVNADAISMSDLEDRMRLIIVSSGLPNTAEIRSKLTGQVLTSLIEEQLKLQEARKLKIEVSQQEVHQGFATLAAQNKFTPEQFRGILARSGINIATMYRQIEAQISWIKIVQSQIRPKISVSDKDIDDALERLSANAGKFEYLVAEIFLPVDDPNGENDARQLAARLADEINSGKALFYKVAQEFSKAAGAENGGDLGWVQQGQLAAELDQVLVTMDKEQVSAPIRSPNGYHILFVRDRRLVTGITLPSREQVLSDIGTQRMDRMQRRYLLDLKASSFVENRVRS